MEFKRTEKFRKDFRKLPLQMQDRAIASLEKYEADRNHPSLHVKKMEGAPDIWEMRVSDNYRITFQVGDGGILLRRIGTHNVLGRE